MMGQEQCVVVLDDSMTCLFLLESCRILRPTDEMLVCDIDDRVAIIMGMEVHHRHSVPNGSMVIPVRNLPDQTEIDRQGLCLAFRTAARGSA